MRRRESRRMVLFRRRRARRESVLDLAPVDRLGDLVDRVVALLEQPRPSSQPAGIRRPEAPPSPAPVPAPPAPAPPAPAAAGRPERLEERRERCVLFVAGLSGYRLVDYGGGVPAPGERVVLEGRGHRVLRLGPSPFPGDRRRCAFLEPHGR